MKKKFTYLPLTLIAFGVVLITANSCKKEDNKPDNKTNGKTTSIFNSKLTYGSLTDQDGNTYKTITIGTQTWMAENLRTGKFRNGESIPEVTDNKSWGNSINAACCNYENSPGIDTIATYGKLYNGYSVFDKRNIAPEGWHVPSIEEWQTLINFLGGDTVAGSKLKESDTIHWHSPNKNTTNESGFTALPSGYRTIVGEYLSLGYYSQWWSSSLEEGANAELKSMYYFSNDIGSGSVGIGYGFSIRCIKDN